MGIIYKVDGKPVTQDEYNATRTSRANAGRSTGSSGGSPSGGSGAGFNLNPPSQTGNGPFGSVPGPLGMPDPAGDLAKVVPNLSSLNKGVSSGILSKLNGQLSAPTLNALKTAQAQFGVSSGMPNSGLSWNSLYGNIAGASEAQQQQGIQDYNPFIQTVSGTQTVNPALQTEIANINSVNAAAPDPAQAASYAQELFNQYLSSMRGSGGGGPGGGTRGGGSPAGGTMPTTRISSPNYYSSPQPVAAPTGPSSFGGASSRFEPDYPPEWDLPVSQDSYGVLAPEYDPGYQPYDSGVPDYDFNYYDDEWGY